MNNSDSRLAQLWKQLELAEMVVKITSGHMWEIHSRDLVREATKTMEEFKKLVKEEEKLQTKLRGVTFPKRA